MVDEKVEEVNYGGAELADWCMEWELEYWHGHGTLGAGRKFLRAQDDWFVEYWQDEELAEDVLDMEEV